MSTGGFAAAPLRTGSTRGTTVEAITLSLVEAKGTAYDQQNGSISYLECHAFARAIAAAASFQRRVSNQFDPHRVTDMLPRWCKIFGLRYAANTPPQDIRAELAVKFRQLGRPASSGEISTLVQSLATSFDSIIYGTSATANTWTTTAVTVPSGIDTVSSGQSGYWSSSLAHIAVKLVKTAYQTENEFYRESGRVKKYLDSFLPAWTTFDVVRDDTVYGAGFFLDTAHNLDNQRFA